jgi:hypothetical protein
MNVSDVRTVASETTSLDVAGAVATEVEATSTRLSVESMEAAYRETPPGARQALLTGYTNALTNRTEALRERERAALRSYNAGRSSAEEYLRTLAGVDATADRLWAMSRFVADRWIRIAGQSGDPSAEIRAELYGLRGPVRDRLQRVSAGEHDPLGVHVTTSDSAFALATYVEANGRETFVRDTYLGGVTRRSSGPDRYADSLSSVVQRFERLYPWAFGVGETGTRFEGFGSHYRASRDHFHGSTTVFLDGESGRVFAEHRVSYLDRIPTVSTSETNATSGLTVTLGQSHRGGPLNVTVTDGDGDPVDATVTVEGRADDATSVVATTGADGTLWTVTPYGPSVVVTAEYDGETVTVVRYARDGPN